MSSPSTVAAGNRLVSIDAYRGLVMLLMLGEALRLSRVSEALPQNRFWKFLAYHQTHVEWAGCSLHDLIQPSFSFLVGVALPFSIAARTARGQSKPRMMLHAFWRAALLVMLGIFLRSLGRPATNFTFEDTLTQIGLGYGFLFLLGFTRWPAQLAALVLILAGYWAAFALYPVPGPEFDRTAVGVPADWNHDYDTRDFAAHWNKNTNAAWAFDVWFLNRFPRYKEIDGEPVPDPFTHNRGGYATLSFIPTLGTMILGLLAGGLLRREAGKGRKFGALVAAAALCFAAGLALHAAGLCPIVKRIWTPSWALFSGGWCFTLLAAFYALIDAAGWRRWAFPLVVVGMNSIVAYCMEWLAAGIVHDALFRHFGEAPFRAFGPQYEPFVHGAVTLLILWLILLWLYRRRIFVRI